MNIEQKMEYIRRALELGANVELNFHNLKKEEEAQQAVSELTSMADVPYSKHENDGTKWFKIRNYADRIYTTVFYDEEYLKEDVDLSGSEFVGGAKHVS
jgi:hypothetical protein